MLSYWLCSIHKLLIKLELSELLEISITKKPNQPNNNKTQPNKQNPQPLILNIFKEVIGMTFCAKSTESAPPFIAFSQSPILTTCLFLYELESFHFKAVTGGYFWPHWHWNTSVFFSNLLLLHRTLSSTFYIFQKALTKLHWLNVFIATFVFLR